MTNPRNLTLPALHLLPLHVRLALDRYTRQPLTPGLLAELRLFQRILDAETERVARVCSARLQEGSRR